MTFISSAVEMSLWLLTAYEITIGLFYNNELLH
ncbi:hypothetical protein DFR66_102131 [Flavobacterium glaciei]|uniref:Uncharacterized protein n=1 Tax=Flavobacterium glaciei TaxID=386300 RepID=A0ABX9I0J2_9FLAO|nr:hypothetical protein DFR66_102131 [Flavobacterium glaciei]